MEINITKKNILKTSMLIVMLFAAYFVGALTTVPTAYQKGLEEGHKLGFADAIQAINDKYGSLMGVTFDWEDLGNGVYQITAYRDGQFLAQANAVIHLNVLHVRNGVLLSNETGAGVLTNIGKDWIELQISGVSTTDRAIYCADSNDATDPALATWTQLPSEIINNGLDRQIGTYASTGVGTWTVTCAKSVTGTQSTQLWGLHWITTDNSNNNLLCSDTGPLQKNCVAGDTLTETWSCTVA